MLRLTCAAVHTCGLHTCELCLTECMRTDNGPVENSSSFLSSSIPLRLSSIDAIVSYVLRGDADAECGWCRDADDRRRPKEKEIS